MVPCEQSHLARKINFTHMLNLLFLDYGFIHFILGIRSIRVKDFDFHLFLRGTRFFLSVLCGERF